MKNKKAKKGNGLVVVISILSLILFFLIFAVVAQIKSGSVRKAYIDNKDMSFYVSSKNYDQIYSNINNNRFISHANNSEYQKFEAVSGYMGELIFKGAYEHEGMESEALASSKTMEEYRTKMSDYNYIADELDAITASKIVNN